MGFKKLVSIVVPVYNAEKFLPQCIESILNQSYQKIELILVNDGSSDRSGTICDTYAGNDSRIQVIHQRNAGPSVARNRGIEAATGQYLQFVDSDDTIGHRMTEKLVQAIDHCQLVLCGYYKVNIKEDGTKSARRFRMAPDRKLTKEEFLKYFGELYPYNFIHYNWNKLYVTAIVKNSGLTFDTEVDWAEDLLFNLAYFEKCDRIHVLEDALYYYMDSNADSITSKFRPNLFRTMQFLQGTVRAFLQRNNAYTGRNKLLFEQFYTSRVLASCWNLFHPDCTLEPEQKRERIREITEDQTVNQYIDYFQTGGPEKRLIGDMIRRKAVNQIYTYYLVKSSLKKRMGASEQKWV